MKRKMKTLLFSILCFSMVSGYCFPTYASEDSVSQDQETVVEENQLPQTMEDVQTEEAEPTSEVVETVPAEEIEPVEETDGGIDLLKTDVFTVTYVLRALSYSMEETKFVTKTFTSKEFPEFDDAKMRTGYYGSEDSMYFEKFNEFILQNAPDGYVPAGKGAASSIVIKESNYKYSYEMVEKDDSKNEVMLYVQYFDETGKQINANSIFRLTLQLSEGTTKICSDIIEFTPVGYVFDGEEFEIQTINGKKYVHVNVKKSTEDRMITMIFLEQKGSEFKRLYSKTIKLSDVAIKDEQGDLVVLTDAVKPYIKKGYVLNERYLYGLGEIFRDHGAGAIGALINTNPSVEIVLKKEYAVEDITGPSVDDDLDVPTVGITVTPEVQAILEDSIVDDTLKTNIKKAISEGKKVTVQVNYDTKDVNKEDLALISNYATKNDMKFIQSFDLGICVVTEDGQVLGQITETTKPLSFDFSLPETLKKEGRKFYVLREHKGVVDPLNVTEDEFHTFNTNRFSTYAIAYTDGTPVVEQETTPQTDEPSKEETKLENKKEESVGTATETNGIRFMTYMLISFSIFLLIAGIKKLESDR